MVFLVMLVGPICLFALVVWLRRADILSKSPLYYNAALNVVYCLSVFLVLPMSDFLGQFIVDFVRGISSAAQGLEVRLLEHGIPADRSRLTMILYCFSIVWMCWSSVFVCGIAAGFCPEDCRSYENDSTPDVNGRVKEMGWIPFSVLGGLTLFMVGGLIYHELMYTPLGDVGCRRRCSSLQFWTFPYFAKLALYFYAWHFFLVFLLKIAMWKVVKRRFINGQ